MRTLIDVGWLCKLSHLHERLFTSTYIARANKTSENATEIDDATGLLSRWCRKLRVAVCDKKIKPIRLQLFSLLSHISHFLRCRRHRAHRSNTAFFSVHCLSPTQTRSARKKKLQAPARVPWRRWATYMFRRKSHSLSSAAAQPTYDISQESHTTNSTEAWTRCAEKMKIMKGEKNIDLPNHIRNRLNRVYGAEN